MGKYYHLPKISIIANIYWVLVSAFYYFKKAPSLDPFNLRAKGHREVK